MNDALHKREYERDRIIRDAVAAADSIVREGADSPEELNYMTGMVAKYMLDKLIVPVMSDLLTRDLLGPDKAKLFKEISRLAKEVTNHAKQKKELREAAQHCNKELEREAGDDTQV